MLPLLCFPQVLFSGAFVPVPRMPLPGEVISWAMTNRWAFEALGSGVGLEPLWRRGASPLGRRCCARTATPSRIRRPAAGWSSPGSRAPPRRHLGRPRPQVPGGSRTEPGGRLSAGLTDPPAGAVPRDRRTGAYEGGVHDRGPFPHQALRRAHRRRRSELHRTTRCGHGIPRAERGGQVHHDADAPRPGRPTSGRAAVNGRKYAEHRAPLHEVGAMLEARARPHRAQRLPPPAGTRRHDRDLQATGERGDRPGRTERGRGETGRRLLPGHGPAARYRRRCWATRRR